MIHNHALTILNRVSLPDFGKRLKFQITPAERKEEAHADNIPGVFTGIVFFFSCLYVSHLKAEKTCKLRHSFVMRRPPLLSI
jgi:hypothetical protein